ncbi:MULTISPECIES: TetR family transcriptional regulator [unclassified Aeromicrobium]|uniref:TetR family transcriptional regulator n=1 Tax=unclassified Aeromicrobium TaxID=2633570 RepID=UPI00396B19D1
MARNAARTRQRLLDAAVVEFSTYGYAGARIERISEAAGVNRERLYSYFGNKRGLLEAVLVERLATALDAAPIRGSGSAAAAAFAADFFDACVTAPDLARLVAWEGLELLEPVDLDRRRERARRKLDDLHAVLPEMAREQVEELLLTVVTLCYGWVVQPHLSETITDDSVDHARRRSAIAQTAVAMVHACRVSFPRDA